VYLPLVPSTLAAAAAEVATLLLPAVKPGKAVPADTLLIAGMPGGSPTLNCTAG
jgi:hypothetical protein